MKDMSTNITSQKNRKSKIRNPRKFKIRDTFWTDHVSAFVIITLWMRSCEKKARSMWRILSTVFNFLHKPLKQTVTNTQFCTFNYRKQNMKILNATSTCSFLIVNWFSFVKLQEHDSKQTFFQHNNSFDKHIPRIATRYNSNTEIKTWVRHGDPASQSFAAAPPRDSQCRLNFLI